MKRHKILTAAVAAAFNGANDKTCTVQKKKKKRKGDVKERSGSVVVAAAYLKKKGTDTREKLILYTDSNKSPLLLSSPFLLLPFFFLSLKRNWGMRRLQNGEPHEDNAGVSIVHQQQQQAGTRRLQTIESDTEWSGSLVSDVYINLKTKGLLCGHLVRRRTHYVTHPPHALVPTATTAADIITRLTPTLPLPPTKPIDCA